MKYKKGSDNRYRVNFMRATEELMDQLTVKEFISYLEKNAEFEDETFEYIDGHTVKCKAYDLTEENSNLHKEFLVTEDGRLFYWLSLIQKVELVDKEESKEMIKLSDKELVNEIKKVANEMQKQFNDYNDTDYKWTVVEKRECKVTLMWSYLDVILEIFVGETINGDGFVKSYDPSLDETIRYYLIGSEFWCDYSDFREGVLTTVRNSVQVMNGIY